MSVVIKIHGVRVPMEIIIPVELSILPLTVITDMICVTK